MTDTEISGKELPLFDNADLGDFFGGVLKKHKVIAYLTVLKGS